MTQTTNYGLNVVEGSDTVNLLTQMNPNTEKIDAQMKTNEDHGIQEATELFTSTVHAITRLKPGAKVFRFTAVSNYTAGETFTVDGVQVTALLTSGEALTTGSFIIGSEVICALRDTLLTVFVNAGTASIAKNAEKLGGELPSYYGTAENVATAVDNAGTALETANAVSGAVGNLSALTTTDKSSCVGAINSLNSNLEKLHYCIDSSNIIDDSTLNWDTTSTSTITVKKYTATEDCVICGCATTHQNANLYIYVNDVEVLHDVCPLGTLNVPILPFIIKKGDTIQINSYMCKAKVFGLK